MGDRLIILNFHGLGTPPAWAPSSEAPYWLSMERFKRILKLIESRNDVEMTFDDGNMSDLTMAVPALLDNRRKATFFIVAERIGQKGYLGTKEVEGLLAAGMAVGNHGWRHERWTDVPSCQLSSDLQNAAARIAQLTQQPVYEVACPFGCYNRRVLSVLKRLESRPIYTSDGGATEKGAWLRARMTIREDSSIRTIQELLSNSSSVASRLMGRLKRAIKRLR